MGFLTLELEFQNRCWAVLGLGKTGLAVAKALSRRGAKLLLFDEKPKDQLLPALERAEVVEAQLFDQGKGLESLQEADFIVTSPGIPENSPLKRSALASGKLVLSEIDLAQSLSNNPIIAVTGTNGKSTTTAWIAEILHQSSIPAVAGGNLDPGEPLITLVDQVQPGTLLVAEVSSFQLEDSLYFHPDIGVLTQIAPDHLDRHKTFENYLEAKQKLFLLQEPSALAVLNADCPYCHRIGQALPQKVFWFSLRREVERGSFVREKILFFRTDNKEIEVGELEGLPLPGQHNLYNALAAATTALLAGASSEGVIKGLRSFRGVPHRMEVVRRVRGVTFVNNSMCTNPEALSASVSAYSQPVILIAGGRNKNLDYREAIRQIAPLTKAVLLIGESASYLYSLFKEAGQPRVQICSHLEEAVKRADALSEEGDVVLFAPGFASMDMFNNFHQRGEAFREIVRRLE